MFLLSFDNGDRLSYQRISEDQGKSLEKSISLAGI
jgi:hypothetical protein